MKVEYPEYYEEVFKNALIRLLKIKAVKTKCDNFCSIK